MGRKFIGELIDHGINARITVKQTRQYFREFDLQQKIYDLNMTAFSVIKGKTNEAISTFTYGHRFCYIAQEEWMVDPLTNGQEFHLPYYINDDDQADDQEARIRYASAGQIKRM